jgi:hypothetical protein
MSKKNKINIQSNIISQIKKGKIKMKSKWYFITGSILMFLSLIGLSMGVIFLINLNIFFVRKNSPFASLKIQTILSIFPWWIPLLAILGVILAIWLLKKYDFSYKKNSYLIIIAFVISIFMGGFLLDKLKLNEYLSRGRMKRIYQRIELNQKQGGSVKGVKNNKQLTPKRNF